MTHPTLIEITERIKERSDGSRRAYLQRMEQMRRQGPHRGALSCSNLAHGFAACEAGDKQALKLTESANIGIVNAYNENAGKQRMSEEDEALVDAFIEIDEE